MPAPLLGAEPPPDLQLTSARIRHYRAGRLAVQATAARAEYHRESQVFDLWDARFTLPGEGGPSLASAARVRYDQRAQSGGAEGGLELANGDERARSERANYDGARNVLESDTAVVLTAPGLVMRAPRWELDVTSRVARLQGGVHMETVP